MTNMEFDLAIVGAGPAGCAAAIYAGRSGVNAVVFDKQGGGGLTVTAPVIENYPGFPSISGLDLVEELKKHAQRFASFRLFEAVESVEKAEDGFFVKTGKDVFHVGAVILGTGCVHRHLGVSGEKELQGAGVSYCATCDGFFFREKTVVVVGGGNSALAEALFLKQAGVARVLVVHRRDQFRAEEAYVRDAKVAGVEFVLNHTVEEILGTQGVEGVKVKDVVSGEVENIACEGVFVSIGENPNNVLAESLGVELDESGFVKVDVMQRTSVSGVFAAGDIAGGVRQVVTATAEGAKAALASLEALGKSYPF